MLTEKVCSGCGKHCVPAQSFCPKCGAALPAATPAATPTGSPHKLLLSKGGEEQVLEFGDLERALNAALPWVMKGYIARVTDGAGVVQYTQALSGGQFVTYPGDATSQAAAAGAPAWGQSPIPGRAKPWWRFW